MSTPAPILQYCLADASMKKLLPSGYTPLAYIESTGTQHINTGYNINSADRVGDKFTCEDTSGTVIAPFGARNNETSNCFNLWVVTGSSYNPQYGVETYTAHPINRFDKLFEVDFNKNKCTINGVTSTLATNVSYTGSKAMYLFALNDGGSIDNRKWIGKCYYFAICNGNGALQVDLRPAKRDSDGAIGMYDLVSRTFKTNAGSGTFIAGPPLAIGKGGGKSLPEEYQQVEYLESDGNQCINTGLVVTSSNGASYDFEAQVVPNSFPSGDVYYTVAGVNSNTQLAWKAGGKACIGNATSSGTFFTVGKMAKITAKFSSSAQTYYVDGTSTGLSRAINTDTNIYLFGINVSGYNMKGKLQYAKFGASAFFIPCYRKSDMKPGMYDVVRSTFYTNASSGEFILGPTINVGYTSEPNAGSGSQQGLYTNLSTTYDSNKGWVADFANNTAHLSTTISAVGNTFSVAWWELSADFNGGMPWGIYPFNPLYSKCLNTGDSANNPWYKPGTTTAISNIANNVWHHFVVTGNGSVNYLYVDGVKYGQSKTFKGLTGTSLVMNGWEISTSYCRNPKITNFQIFNVALTDAQVKELYVK